MPDLFGLVATVKIAIDPVKVMAFIGALIVLGYLKKRFIK